MPELPEVETTRRGIEPAASGQTIIQVVVRQNALRWPVPKDIGSRVEGAMVSHIRRRAKYLLLETDRGTIIIHLGMSGTLRVVDRETPVKRHDHVDLLLGNGVVLRFRDPRRFGAVLHTRKPIEQHPLLQRLGIEPVLQGHSAQSVGDHLHALSRRRRGPIKSFIMDQKVITGVGNIYACEALFLSGIHPRRGCHRISRERYHRLAEAIQETLTSAIEQGGTTLQDFRNSEGRPGYFRQQLSVYGRDMEPCTTCGRAIRRIVQGQRSTWYCPRCQH